MTEKDLSFSQSSDGRVLILAPTGRDAALAAEALTESGLRSEVCPDMDTLCQELASDAAAALIASEALTFPSVQCLSMTLAQQPPWSDLPLIILTSGGGSSAVGLGRQIEALDPLGIATLLERPLRVSTLIHAVRAALGARRRQYEVRDHLEERARLQKELQAEYIKQRLFLRDVLASVTGGRLRLCHTADDLPTQLPVASRPMALSMTGGLSELRHGAKLAALTQGFAPERWQDLLTAVGEASMNAAVHGGGGTGRVFAGGAGTVQVWVDDQGQGIDVEDLPRAALSKGYTTVGSLGHGMKMMLETADRLWLLTSPSGTTVVIEQDRLPPKPTWY